MTKRLAFNRLLIVLIILSMTIPILNFNTIIVSAWGIQVVIETGLATNNMAPPVSNKLVRTTNGSLFCTYYTGDYGGADNKVYLKRSIDKGLTWTTQFMRDSVGSPYDATLTIDSKNNLYLFWSEYFNDGVEDMRIMNLNLSYDMSHGLIYNLTENVGAVGTAWDTLNQECSAPVVNASNAVYCFFYGRTTSIPALQNLRYKCYYKGTWSTVYNITTDKVDNQYFPSVCVDYQDRINLVWMAQNASIGGGLQPNVYYKNFSKGIWYGIDASGNPISSATPAAVFGCHVSWLAYEQLAACVGNDINNNVHIAWSGVHGASSGLVELRYRNLTMANNTWSSIRNLTAYRKDQSMTSVVANSNGNLTIVYQGKSNHSTDSYSIFTQTRKNGIWYELMIGNKTGGVTGYITAIRATYPMNGSISYQIPKTGVSCLYRNSTKIEYMNDTAMFPGMPTVAELIKTHSNDSAKRNVIIDSNGTMYMAYDYNGSTVSYVNVSRSFDNGITWTHWRSAYDAGADKVRSVTIGKSNNGFMLVTWQQGTTKLGCARYWENNNTWTAAYVHRTVAKGLIDVTFVSYKDDNNFKVFWSECVPNGTYNIMKQGLDGTWDGSIINVTTSGNGYYQTSPSPTVDSNKTMHVVWQGAMPDHFYNYTLRYRNQDVGGTWSNINNLNTSVSGENWDNQNPSTIIDSNGNLHVTWQANFKGTSSNYNIRYMNRTKTTWRPVTNITEHKTIPGISPTISIMRNDSLTIIWNGSDGTGYQMQGSNHPKNSASWSAPINLTGHHTNAKRRPEAICALYPSYNNMPLNKPIIGFGFSYWNQTTMVFYRFPVPGFWLGSSVASQNISTEITNKSIILHGFVASDALLSLVPARFLVGTTSPVTWANALYNVSAGNVDSSGAEHMFLYNLSVLSATRYYAINYILNSFWLKSNNTRSFLTKPNLPTSLTNPDTSGVKIYLKWINPYFGTGIHINKTVARYSTDAYPTNPLDGVAGFNVSGTSLSFGHGNITGLSPGTTYYISVWSYVDSTGLGFSFSREALHMERLTPGGQYNITFRWENTTWHHPFPNPKGTSNVTLIVHYATMNEYNFFNTTKSSDSGYYNCQSDGNFNKTIKGYVLLNLSYLPLWFEVQWNDSEHPIRCNRMRVVEAGVKNYTFYVYTDKMVYGESTANANNSLIKYKLSFTDAQGIFQLPPTLNSIYAYFYTYDDEGIQQIIHSEYLDSVSSSIHPWFLYGKNYYIGINGPSAILPSFQTFTADTSGSISGTGEVYQTIYITSSSTSNISGYNATQVRVGYITAATGIWCHYWDPANSIVDTWLRIYDFNNNTKGIFKYGSNAAGSDFNYTYLGSNNTRAYLLELQLNLTAGTYGRGIYFDRKIWRNITMIPGITPRWSYSNINNTMTTIFGYTPFRSYERPGGNRQVPWTDVVVFAIFLMILCTFSGYNAGIAGFASGGWWIFAGTLISGSPWIWIPAGIITIIFTILYVAGEQK